MSYVRFRRDNPNFRYDEIHRDEIKYLFDILNDNTVPYITKITGFDINFVQKTLDQYVR